MPTINDITVLNIDEVPYAVESLSEEVQALVEVYNNWNKKESDARGELAILQAAKQTLSGQIVAKVRAETATEAATEEANVTTDDSNADIVVAGNTEETAE